MEQCRRGSAGPYRADEPHGWCRPSLCLPARRPCSTLASVLAISSSNRKGDYGTALVRSTPLIAAPSRSNAPRSRHPRRQPKRRSSVALRARSGRSVPSLLIGSHNDSCSSRPTPFAGWLGPLRRSHCNGNALFRCPRVTASVAPREGWGAASSACPAQSKAQERRGRLSASLLQT